MAETVNQRRLRLLRWSMAAMVLALSLCPGAGVSCGAQESARTQQTALLKSAKRLRLDVPAAENGKNLLLVIRAGALPAGASLLIYSEAGQLIGSVSPFGAQERESGGRYTLPLPANLHPGAKFTVLCVLQLDARHWRRPKAAELIRAAIVANAAQ